MKFDFGPILRNQSFPDEAYKFAREGARVAMKTEMLMPQMGESIAEATILKWRKGIGERVEKDETILEISTDKVDSEIPAPAAGVIVELKAKEGDTVPVKSVIAIIDAAAKAGDVKTAATPAPEKTSPAAEATPAATSNGSDVSSKPSAPSRELASGEDRTPPRKPSVNREDGAEVQIQPQAPSALRAKVQREDGAELEVTERFYSPLVKSLAAEHGLSVEELGSISGSGAQGRVTKADVLDYLESRGPGKSAPRAAEAPAAKSEAPAAPRPTYDASGTVVQPMDNMRKLIADHMVRSKATSPHVYSVAEVDVTNIAKWREKNQPAFLGRQGYKLSFTPFFLEAVTKALIQFPGINASVEGTNLILKKNINLGCAVALGNTGLIVPVIKNADQLSLIGIAHSLNDLANRARIKKLLPEEIQGGTFTLTNVGTFGNIIGCPIINQPQLAILAVGAIKKRVMVINDAIAIRDMVYLTLSYDHRVIDGSLSGQFLQFITKYLEGWDMKRELY